MYNYDLRVILYNDKKAQPVTKNRVHLAEYANNEDSSNKERE